MSMTSGQQANVGDPAVVPQKLPRLEAGDRLDQPTFHARYEAMPSGFRAELIDGVVHVPSPVQLPHMRSQADVLYWVQTYGIATPVAEGYASGTVILDIKNEPEPDALLVLKTEFGGRTRAVDNYLHGSPELAAEIASSTESHDLHRKKPVYERAGIQEYLVVAVRQQLVYWFRLQEGVYVPITPDDQGILKSVIFPGLWLDSAALLKGEMQRVVEVLRRGLESPEHKQWLAGLTGK